jgi:L-seryl-tRNA(Ser) seleniumtransferase
MRPPSVDRLARSLVDTGLPHPLLVDVARAAIAAGDPASARALATDLRRALLQRVVNATGVLLHTNLGRAPLGWCQPAGSTNLELDLTTGARGSRHAHCGRLLARLCDAEAAIVVNNNAAAVLLVLAALARGRQVLVSRGESVEIGGGFRVPEVMAQSGARLREVGTTNRTRIADYRQAIGADTALLLRVHRSNFRIEGFTEQPTLGELAQLGRESGVPVAEDLGSGYIGLPGQDDDTRLDALLGGEPRVQASLAAGLDVVCFSGDKLLGGPQAGIIVGRMDLVARVRRHPLMRAVRVDKLTYAALEATLAEYVSGRAGRTIPIMGMILATNDSLNSRCEHLVARLSGVRWLEARVEDGPSAVGGGTTPGLELPSRVVALRHARQGPDWLDGTLRGLETPIVGRIERDRLVLDLRTVLEDEDDALAAGLARTSGN